MATLENPGAKRQRRKAKLTKHISIAVKRRPAERKVRFAWKRAVFMAKFLLFEADPPLLLFYIKYTTETLLLQQAFCATFTVFVNS